MSGAVHERQNPCLLPGQPHAPTNRHHAGYGHVDILIEDDGVLCVCVCIVNLAIALSCMTDSDNISILPKF